jgi:hypothetical protein
MHCSKLTLPSLRSSSSQLTKLHSSKQQVGELPWISASTFHIFLLSTDLAAFLNYEQIIIHICPRLVKYKNKKITLCLRIALVVVVVVAAVVVRLDSNATACFSSSNDHYLHEPIQHGYLTRTVT